MDIKQSKAFLGHRAAFLAAVSGMAAHWVDVALREQVHMNWSKCPKGAMADEYASAKVLGQRAVFPQMAKVDLALLAEKAAEEKLKSDTAKIGRRRY